MFKFNVDGSVRGKLGLARCDGIFHNSEAFLAKIFFGPLGIQDYNYAELMAALNTLRLFLAFSYASYFLCIESDSNIALTWVEQVDQRPWDKCSIFN